MATQRETKLETIEGTIKDISRPFGGGWRFASVRGIKEKVTGVFPPDVEPGDYAVFTGKWEENAKYGKQFKVTDVRKDLPRDTMGIIHYLDRYRWVGPILGRRLVEHFGESLFTVIEHDHARLAEVNGITTSRADEIHEKFMDSKGDLSLDLFFSEHGITTSLQNRLLDAYSTKEKARKMIEANPYILSMDVFGVAFKTADRIALSTGIRKESRRRLTAGIDFVLREAANGEGHSCLPRDDLVKKSVEILEASRERVIEVMETMMAEARLIDYEARDGSGNSTTDIYTAKMFDAEMRVAEKLRELVNSPYEEAMSSELAPEDISSMDADQRRGLELALSSKVMILTGGPGTGKTFLINNIIRAMGSDKNIALAAPTGKASKRMQEASGHDATTIHRLLAFHPEAGFRVNADNPLKVDVLIVDEMSMTDINLMANLMDAVTSKTQIIFVGDSDQLASVGAGRVLGDMIDSGVIPVVRLATLHRQAAKSYINRNAQKINRGKKIELPNNNAEADFFFVPQEEDKKIPETIEMVCVKFAAHYGFALTDIQVLCPMKKGPAGTIELNRRLRLVINKDGVQIPGTPFMVGDRVIQMKNNYGLGHSGIFNGDMGVVLGGDASSITVKVDDQDVEYPMKDFDQLQLAYSLTIHKSQGSEFPVVVIPMHTIHAFMLQRTLLYTAITRARRYVIVVGTQKAINMAIRKEDTSRRHSNLARMLRGG